MQVHVFSCTQEAIMSRTASAMIENLKFILVSPGESYQVKDIYRKRTWQTILLFHRGIVLLKQHEDWMIGKKYMNIESLRSLDDQPELETIELIEP